MLPHKYINFIKVRAISKYFLYDNKDVHISQGILFVTLTLLKIILLCVKLSLNFFNHRVWFSSGSRLVVQNLLKFHYNLKFQQILVLSLNKTAMVIIVFFFLINHDFFYSAGRWLNNISIGNILSDCLFQDQIFDVNLYSREFLY
jgi:hypothetical protein